ncbi:MAG: DnaJ domain-containing protein [Candidatus Micrarchaeaceae archaeon]
MGLLDKVAGRLERLGNAGLEYMVKRLIKGTDEAEDMLRSEAKKFGIMLEAPRRNDYYETLGISYTDDQKAIRNAYLQMIKKYHPDVNKEELAKERSKEINEAYSVLKDKGKKSEYDAHFSKSSRRARVNAAEAEEMVRALADAYAEIRMKEFMDFNKRVSMPQSIESIEAAIEDVTNWKRSLSRAASRTFGSLLDSGAKIRRLRKLNARLMKSRYAQGYWPKLDENLRRLEALAKSSAEMEKEANFALEKFRHMVEKEESKMKQRLRNSIH